MNRLTTHPSGSRSELLSMAVALILTAGGDTKTVIVVNSVSVWVFCVLPSVIWLTYFPLEAYTVSLYSFPIYGAIVTGILYLRVRSNKWIKLDLSNAK